ncbi:MAG TPA: alanine racemase, partial [Legionellaceae bacterium]|nr:alanine racemase [Legionellaceae bacterium]
MSNTIPQKYPTDIVIPTTHSTQLTWIEIDKEAFNHNVQQYKRRVQPALFAIVVKSNAYGHGMHQIASLAEANPHVDYLCTVSLSEAVALREHSIQKPIIVLSILDSALEQAFMHDIELVLFDMQQALLLQSLGKKQQKKISVHIKVDTGLSRLGILHTAAHAFIKEVAQLSHIHIKGIFTHFAQSEKKNQTFTNLQIQRLETVIDSLRKDGIEIPLRHSSCSAAITANTKSHFTLARAGIGIYGLWPSLENQATTQETDSLFSLKPVLTWKTKIIQIKEIPTRSSIGYDRTFITKKISRIATLPVGYWDGYDRKLSNKGYVYINDHRAPIAGRIAMN